MQEVCQYKKGDVVMVYCPKPDQSYFKYHGQIGTVLVDECSWVLIKLKYGILLDVHKIRLRPAFSLVESDYETVKWKIV